MSPKMEKKIDEFYSIIYDDVLNYFLYPNNKNKYLSHERIKLIINDLICFLNYNGFYIFTDFYKLNGQKLIYHSPKLFSFTVLPQKFNKEFLELGKKCTMLYSEIIDNMVCDMPFILKLFENVIKSDEFLRNTISICERVYLRKREHGRDIKNDIRCVIGRSDYMVDIKDKDNEKNWGIKQVEYNTISTAFGCLSSIIYEAHKNSIKEIYREYFPYLEKSNEKEINEILDKKFENNYLNGIITCFSECHNLYISNYNPLQGKHKTVILSVIRNNDLNNFDKYKTKCELKKLGINNIFLTLEELQIFFQKKHFFLSYNDETLQESLTRIKENTSSWDQLKPGKLLLNMNDESVNLLTDINYEHSIFEVSVVYFRSLYSPSDFNETIWKLREMIEYSNAVKIPCLPYQLLGSKRIQMLLTYDDILRKYISIDINKNKKTEDQILNEMQMLKTTFAFQMDPSLDENANIVSLAIQNPKNFILKPQREGGNNNLHNNQIKEKLMLYYSPEKRKELSQYVLMKKICSHLFTTVHCRTTKKNDKIDLMPISEFFPEQSMSEIGFFHNFIFYKNTNILNEQKGYLIRTKNSSENEGGAICGISSIDSIFLEKNADK